MYSAKPVYISLFFSLSLSVSLSLYIYIYIYMCVRVWVWVSLCWFYGINPLVKDFPVRIN